VATWFRLRPRYRGVAWSAIGVGAALAGVAVATMGAALAPVLAGATGIALGAGYLTSPAWRLAVVVDDEGLEVRGKHARKFFVAWRDIVRVVASPTTRTCFVDGGASEHSLIVPGVGAPAPYDIENKRALYDAILAHIDRSKVQEVETLEASETRR
jgi:hypothetical protein